MRKFVLPFFLLLFLTPHFCFSQSHFPPTGEFTSEEINMKECPFDKDANAVILFDDATTNYDDNYELITTRRIRIKILNNNGVDEGTIRIPFRSGDNFEFIRNITGVTYTPNENGILFRYELDKKTIFTEKNNEYFSTIKFAMPNVKAGSIIEYQYESVKKHYGGLKNWEFQSYLPTIKSCFLLTIIPNAEFTYLVQKKKIYPIVIRPMPETGQVYFEMSNIPGLKEEPFMDAPKDYLQRVEFQFSGYTTVESSGYGTNSSKEEVNTTWKQLAGDLFYDKDFGGVLKKNLSPIDDVKNLVAKKTTETDKLIAIYNYVRSNFTSNEFYGVYASDGLKSVWDNRKGDASEINFILINLLQTFDIEAHPLLVAERDFGKVDTLYPLIDRFNKTVAYAVADGNTYILDATQKYCPAWITPFPLLNTYAFLVDTKKFKLFKIENNNETYRNDIIVEAKLDSKGMLSGKVEITSDDYAKQLLTEVIQDDEKKFIDNKYLKIIEGLGIDSFYCENLKDDTLSLIQHFLFKRDMNESGGFVLFDYNMFTGLEKNPFKKEERFTNIDFGFPYYTTMKEKILLPPNAKVDDLPKNKTLVTPDRHILLKRQMKVSDNYLEIDIDFQQMVTLVSNEDYDGLKEFYTAIIGMLNEPVTIKLGN